MGGETWCEDGRSEDNMIVETLRTVLRERPPRTYTWSNTTAKRTVMHGDIGAWMTLSLTLLINAMKAMVSGHRAITQTAEERSVTMGRESPFQFTIDFEKTLANCFADEKVCQRKIPLGQRKGKRQEEMADIGSWNRWRQLEFSKAPWEFGHTSPR